MRTYRSDENTANVEAIVEKKLNLSIRRWTRRRYFVYRKIVFSDEAHFWLHGFAIKQNFRFRSEDNKYHVLETPLGPEKYTIFVIYTPIGLVAHSYLKMMPSNTLRSMDNDTVRWLTIIICLQICVTWTSEKYGFSRIEPSTERKDLLKTQFSDNVIPRNGLTNSLLV